MTPTELDTATMLEDLATLVACESPSTDAEAIARSADVVADLGQRLLGRPPERRGPHLRWSFGRPSVLVLGHHDTVWPLGTLARWPFAADADRATGPGCFDMKAGIVQALHALARLDTLDGVCVLLTGDEEVGALDSEALIRDTARGTAAALVAEPSVDGAVKTARKGIRNYELRISGRAAHAGLDPERGINAGVELGHQLVAVAGLRLPEDTTLVPTVARAGTTENTVPASASARLDMRAFSVAAMDEVEARLQELAPVLVGAGVEVVRHHARPPMPPSSSTGLYELARRAAADLGIAVPDGVAVGGVSDGNFAAAEGVATLDGLGAVGDGAHAEGEWVHVPSMPERAALLGELVARLQAGEQVA